MKNSTILITRAQVEHCDLELARILDPERFSKSELASLCGALRFRFENAAGPDDVFLQPATRHFVQSLHKSWPWAGFFLQCQPLHSDSSNQEIMDVGVLVSWALCHTEDITVMRWTDPYVVGMRYHHDQFLAAVVDITNRAEELCLAAGMTKRVARRRRQNVFNSIRSFFELGETQKENLK